ncbi:MAG: hypothetical protein FK733_17400 [Asgard group archaeon]|nr:hypothetical protein [Asgard group archaeon]
MVYLGVGRLVSNNVYAILLGILANSIKYIGLVLSKKGACMVPEIETQTIWQNFKNFAKCKTWLIGFILTVVQWFPLMVAVRIGSLSVVAPTIVIGFIVLIIFSWFYLKEPIRVIEIISMLIVIAAIITLYVVAPVEPIEFDLITQFNQFFKKTKAIAFICSFAAIIIILILITNRKQFPQAGALLAIASGLSYATAIIFAKAAVGTLNFNSGTEFVANSLGRWEWYIYLVLMCIFYAIAFPIQQKSFQKGKAIVVTPTVDVMNIFTQVIAGIVIFNEWADIWGGLELWKKALKVLSIILIVISVALLSFLTAKDEMIVTPETMKDEEEIKVENQSL